MYGNIHLGSMVFARHGFSGDILEIRIVGAALSGEFY
jgi:hypothetical protein